MSLLLQTRGKKDSNILNLRIPGFKVEYLPKNPVSHFTDAGYRRHKNYTSLGNGRVSRVEGHRSRVIGRGSYVEVLLITNFITVSTEHSLGHNWVRFCFSRKCKITKTIRECTVPVG